MSLRIVSDYLAKVISGAYSIIEPSLVMWCIMILFCYFSLTTYSIQYVQTIKMKSIIKAYPTCTDFIAVSWGLYRSVCVQILNVINVLHKRYYFNDLPKHIAIRVIVRFVETVFH